MRLLSLAISEAKSDIRFASKVEMATGPRDVCFTPQKRTSDLLDSDAGGNPRSETYKTGLRCSAIKGRSHGPALGDADRPPDRGCGHLHCRCEPSAVTQAEEKTNGA